MMLTNRQWRFLQNNCMIRDFDFLALEQSHFHQTLHEGIVTGEGGNSSRLAGRSWSRECIRSARNGADENARPFFAAERQPAAANLE